MRRVSLVAIAPIVALGILVVLASSVRAQAPETSVTVFEGARLIVGDGGVIENATLVVEGASISQVGQAADVRVPAGATRVDLAGKTVMPMIIDTHVHLSPTRDALIRDLKLARLLWCERRAESWHGQLRITRRARPDDSRRRAVSECRAWDHDARTGAHNRALLDYDRGGRSQGGGGARGAQG